VLSFSALESGQDDEPDQEENQHREVDEDGHLTPLPFRNPGVEYTCMVIVLV
jgi:hypothetical protein